MHGIRLMVGALSISPDLQNLRAEWEGWKIRGIQGRVLSSLLKSVAHRQKQCCACEFVRTWNLRLHSDPLSQSQYLLERKCRSIKGAGMRLPFRRTLLGQRALCPREPWSALKMEGIGRVSVSYIPRAAWWNLEGRGRKHSLHIPKTKVGVSDS